MFVLKFMIFFIFLKGGFDMKREIMFFEKFVSNYDLSIDELQYKLLHTYRVVNYAKNIANFLELDERLVDKVYISALFHDLGRFPQFSEYHTFLDQKSFDHGDKSYEILKSINYKDETVLNAVKYHNKYEVPQHLSEEDKLVCNIVRDADKLDILHYRWKIDKQKHKISQDIVTCFEKHKLVENTKVKYPVDAILRQLSFIFDLNFDVSLDMVYSSNVIDRNIDIVLESCKDKKAYQIQEILDNYVAKKLGVKKYERIRKKI